jgi:hypothetical protein
MCGDCFREYGSSEKVVWLMKWRVPDGLLFTAYALPLFSLSAECEKFAWFDVM